MTQTAKNNLKRIVLLLLLLAAVLVYALVPAVHDWVGTVLKMFSSGDFTQLRDFIRSYEGWAILVSFLLMIFQSLAAPLPSFLLAFANAAVFGWWKGFLITWVSSWVAAGICFFIGRILGRDVVEKLVTRGALASVDEFFERHGSASILIARLIPFISFDVVSYAAGLTPMNFWSFLLATAIGELPATIAYSYVGGMLTGGAKLLTYALSIIFAAGILIVLVRQVWQERQKKKAAAADGQEGTDG